MTTRHHPPPPPPSVYQEFINIMDDVIDNPDDRPTAPPDIAFLARDTAAFYFELIENGLDPDVAVTMTESFLNSRYWDTVSEGGLIVGEIEFGEGE